jgi:homoserine kinase
MEEIRVFAPATVANVSCGFDVLGFAMSHPGDELIARTANHTGIRISEITGDGGRLPRGVHNNTAGVAAQALLNHLGSDRGFDITLHKKMPLGSGLGSSAASAVASVFAINQLLGEPLKTESLLPFAMEGERIACGAAHADNVAPSLLGGFVLIRSYTPLEVVKLECRLKLWSTVISPEIEVNTRDARDILKRHLSMEKAIQQWGNLGGLIAGLLTPDAGLVGRSLQDVVAEPVRGMLIPGFYDVKQAAIDAGALGAGISGSGPSIFALSADPDTAHRVGQAMKAAFAGYSISSSVYTSEINTSGPVIM